MEKLEEFFLKNLAYCTAVKHRNPAESLYCRLSRDNEHAISNEVNQILNEANGEHLIFMFFLDKQTKEDLHKMFKDISFGQFYPYFDACFNSILNDNLALNYMFQFVNFFHLIGTLRLLKDFYEQKDKINDLLLNIIDSQKIPFLIRYSASQIFVSKDLKNLNVHENGILLKFYAQLINKINSDDSFTRFVALYSIYYNSFSMKTDIMRELKELIINGKNVDFNTLHTYLPQIHSILVRSNKSIFENILNTQQFFVDLYSIDENRSDKIIEILNRTDKIL